MKHWFITGISRGFGLALAKAALERGDKVVGTVRGQAPELVHGEGQLHVLKVDMTDEDRVVAAVHEAFAIYGRIDVIVNNAGYGVLGAVEASTDEELKTLFAVDVFAPVRIVRTALPYLRQQGAGHIINITSIAGRAPGVGSALYAAAKFALEGFTAALAKEVEQLGIKVTAVAPGQFRTDFLNGAPISKGAAKGSSYSPAVDAALSSLASLNHNQPGDPELAANAIVDTAHTSEPPLHLLLGSDALKRAQDKISTMLQEMRAWEPVTVSTDFQREE